MPVLAIDTATMVSSAAIVTDGKLLSEIIMQLNKPQSEVLMNHIINALDIAHVKKQNLTGIAVNIGPGSFTGLRIGLATAKMMSYALNIPVTAIPIDEVLAYHYPVENIYLATFIDAQKGNVYFSIKKWQNNVLQNVQELSVLSLMEAIETCEKLDLPVIAIGDIVQKKYDQFDNCTNTSVALAHHIMPCAANTGLAGLRRFATGKTDNIMTLEPLYIRRSEAEELWEKRHRETNSEHTL